MFAMLGLPFVRRNHSWREALKTNGVFLAFLGVVWVLSRTLVTPGWCDTVEYHIPAVRLLIEGWNPVWDPSAGEIAAAVGVDLHSMRWTHMLFMPKSTWYFSAVSSFFTGDTLNLFFPIFAFLFSAVAITVWRTFARWGRRFSFLGLILLSLAVVLFYPSTVCYAAMVDCTVCLAGIGLMLAMRNVLASGRWCWGELLTYSFWMCTPKQPGMMSCFVFWCVCGVWLLVRDRKQAWGRIVAAGCIIGVLVSIVCVSPYMTNIANYGYPLYPNFTVDAHRFPIMDINKIQKDRNDDAKALGWFGNVCNSYISPQLTRAFYKWKLGKESFAPRCRHWEGGTTDSAVTNGILSPLSDKARLCLWVLFVLVVTLGNSAERVLGGAAALAMVAFPDYLLGDLRMVPWVYGVALLVLLACASHKCCWVRRSAYCGLLCWWMVAALPLQLLGGAILIDRSYALRNWFESDPPRAMYALEIPYDGVFPGPSMTYSSWKRGNMELMKRQVPALKDTKIMSVVLESEDDARASGYAMSYDYSFWTDDLALPSRYSDHCRLIAKKDRRERLRGYPCLVMRAYVMTLSRLLACAW